MSAAWFKNLAGLNQEDDEMMYIPRPVSELTIHVTFKTIQMGTLLGSVGGPLYLAFRTGGEASNKDLTAAATRSGLGGAAIGLLLGPALTYMACKDMSDSEIVSRCYKLRWDRQTLISDRVTAMAACLGSLYAGKKGFVFGLDTGFLIGELLGSKFSDY